MRRSTHRTPVARRWIAVAMAIAATWVTAGRADANNCTLASHCYADAQSIAEGVDDYITPSCLYAPDGNFDTNEVWVMNPSRSAWVEGGYEYKNNIVIDGSTVSGRLVFWAYRDAVSGFSRHTAQTGVPLSSQLHVRLSHNSGTVWNVNLVRPGLDFHTTQNVDADDLSIGVWGTESTNSDYNSYGTCAGATHESVNDGQFYGTMGTITAVRQDSPLVFNWITTATAFQAGVYCH